jgi:anaerobic magnesium-protoporphyrin IX monomethyl ester cyclase
MRRRWGMIMMVKKGISIKNLKDSNKLKSKQLKVFLGNAPWRPQGRLGIRAGSRWPWSHKRIGNEKKPDMLPFPFFLAYATSLLEKNNIDVLLIDAIAEGIGIDAFLNKIVDYNADVVVLETSTPSIYTDLKIAKAIKEKTNAKIVLTGPHVTIMGEDILKYNDFIDYVIIGEYEFVLLDLIIALENNDDFKNVKGLIYRNKEKIFNNGRAPLRDINELPWPARKYLPMYSYSDAFAGLPTPDVQMWASRGCPFHCIFCVWPDVMYGGQKYRSRDYKDVVNEMEYLVKKYEFKSVYFDDDTFDIGKERIINMCREIRKRSSLSKIKWSIMARADTCDYEMLLEMKKAGLYAVKYGVESGVQELVNNLKKNLDLSKVKKMVYLTKKLGIKVHLTFTFGLPGENWDTIKKTIKFSHELNPDSIQFSITTPFPGTKYFDILEKENNILTKDWSQYDGAYSCVMRTKNLSEKDLEKALNLANDSWKFKNLRRNMLKYALMGLRHPLQAMNYIFRAFYSKLNV